MDKKRAGRPATTHRAHSLRSFFPDDVGRVGAARLSVGLAALLFALALAGCQPADLAGEKVASALNHYCGLSQPARELVRTKVKPYLEPGVSAAVTCPGDTTEELGP